MLQEPAQVGALQDSHVLDPPAGLLAGLQLHDRVNADPAAPRSSTVICFPRGDAPTPGPRVNSERVCELPRRIMLERG